MRKWLFLSFSINILLIIVALRVLPEHVATHFGLGGHPDAWGSRESYAWLMLTVEVPLFLLQLILPYAVLKVPERIINLPNKEYWFKAENKPRLQVLFRDGLAFMGTAFFVFLALVQGLVLQANLSHPVRLRGSLFMPLLAAFVIFMIYWTVKFIRTFRVPEHRN